MPSSLENSDQGDRAEVKLLGIAGVGFFLDAYDRFVINPVATMLQYRLYDGKALPAGLQGLLKAGANIRYLADTLGRKAIYGKELMLVIFATIMCLTTPTGTLSPDISLRISHPWHWCWRRGVLVFLRWLRSLNTEADYPMSASITSDCAVLRKRGTMLAYIFSNQGWGSLVGSLVTIVVLAAYKHVMNDEGKTSKVDGVWRIVVGISLIPAFGTLYQRLTLPESTRFQESQNPRTEVEVMELHHYNGSAEETAKKAELHHAHTAEVVEKESHFKEFLVYFSEWRHAKILLGTCLCWFLLDIAYILQNQFEPKRCAAAIGFDGKTGTPWEKLFRISTGNIIITVLGFVPGYYTTVLLIETLGRKWIQIQGFLMAALFLAILAAKLHTLSKPGFIVCFALLQFFFNFGANTTTYCYPAEVFPTRFRAFAHGLSAAAGKAGAIISALVFNSLSMSIGTDKVLWILVGCCVAGAACTLLLPEVRARDPDEVLAYEMADDAARRQRR
ncbi:major facilitator superfamily domain-containing protein [Mycena metata]|uniref:Major facilitator superfamily domain-containing protein n=1 Tax=Mycena metata TaxID=1033252 RepID=A0AAD7NK49_9AGAR|nr:major facilitator superfamily domain-containing protein [Mycena metata]